MSGGLEQATMELRESRVVLEKLTETFDTLQSHCFSVVCLSEQWQDLQTSFSEAQDSVGTHVKELERRENEVSSLRKVLERREEEVELRRKRAEFETESLKEECMRVKVRENEVTERWREVEERCEVVERREKEVEEREKKVEERIEAVGRREKDVDDRCGGIELEEERIGKRCIVVERRGKEVEKRFEEVERREKEIDECRKAVEERMQEVELREKGVDERRKAVEECVKEVELREKGIELEEERIVKRCIKVVRREKVVEERFKEVELRKKEIDECWKAVEERIKEVELREKGIDERRKEVELEEKKLSQRCGWWKWKEESIDARMREVQSKEREIDERLRKLGPQLDLSGSSTVPEMMTDHPHSDKFTGVTGTVVSNLCKHIQSSCRNMDADGLRSYLNQHMNEHASFYDAVLNALQVAPDPTKLVINVLQIILSQSSPIENFSCIFLLELLMKLQQAKPSLNLLGHVKWLTTPLPQMTPDSKYEAKTLASTWKCRLLKDGGSKPLEVYCFLLFLATYKLASSFRQKELLRLFRMLYGCDWICQPEHNPYLCRALGLTEKIPDLVQSLIKKRSRLEALKYICTFMLENRFPLAQLLNDHVKFAQEEAEIKRVEGQYSIEAKAKATEYEMCQLQTVVHYIKEYELDSECSLAALESRIKELKMGLAESKTVTTAQKITLITCFGEIVGSCKAKRRRRRSRKHGGVENHSEKTAHEIAVKSSPDCLSDTHLESFGGIKRTANPSISLPLLQPQEKRPRVGAVESPLPPNTPTPTPSEHQRSMNPSLHYQDVFPQTEHGNSLRHLGHGRPQGNPVQSPERLPSTIKPKEEMAEESSSSTYVEKGQEEKNHSAEFGKETVLGKNIVPGSPLADTKLDTHVGTRYTARPSTAIELPAKDKPHGAGAFQSPGPPKIPGPVPSWSRAFQSPGPPNIPGHVPTPVHPMLINSPDQGSFFQPQPRPCAFQHPSHVRPNGHPMWSPGPLPTTHRPPSSYHNVPGGGYGVPPPRANGQYAPAGFYPGSGPAPGYYGST